MALEVGEITLPLIVNIFYLSLNFSQNFYDVLESRDPFQEPFLDESLGFWNFFHDHIKVEIKQIVKI